MIRNYKFTVSYDGSRYLGWEHQKQTDRTIQGKIETVLARMAGLIGPDELLPVDPAKEPLLKLIGAGRTDAGVHAEAMVCNAFLDTVLSEDEILDYMNRYLPDDIAVSDVRIASERFHSRYQAVGKTYRYTFYCGRIKPVFDRKYVTVIDREPDLARMKAAAALLIGTHDFKSFCGNPKMKKSTVRTVDSIEIRRSGSYIRIFVHGDGFLQHMVRIIAGTLLEVGLGKRESEEIPAILEAMDRTSAGYTAPPEGLCLVKIDY